mmetsp:Transcript_103513/g.302060  ORF Transcript_103513/g.302060 Transcript_103513/m.302060 type:complete len:260 (+) Transcript_103513:497-1276(+)
MYTLAILAVTDAKHGNILYVGMLVEHVLDLLRVYVHTTRDDHVCLPVRYVEESILVKVADITHGKVVAKRRILRLVSQLVVPFDIESLGKNLTSNSGFCDFLLVVIEQYDINSGGWLATGSWLLQHVLRAHDGHSTNLRRPVELVKYGTKRLDDAVLDARRTSCSAGHDGLHALAVEAGSRLLRDLQQSFQQNGRHVHSVHLESLDASQSLLCIKFVHEYEGGAQGHANGKPSSGHGVIQRSTLQDHRVRHHSEEAPRL